MHPTEEREEEEEEKCVSKEEAEVEEEEKCPSTVAKGRVDGKRNRRRSVNRQAEKKALDDEGDEGGEFLGASQ